MPEWSVSVTVSETFHFSSNGGEMVLHTVDEIDDRDECLQEKTLKKKFWCKNNKKKKQQPFSDLDSFKFTDYDSIGFDLDNTICRYKVGELMRMEYNYIAEYLVNQYGFPNSLLLPIEDDMDFIQKGLIMDISRGNFMKISDKGVIIRATHGTRPLTRVEIKEIYGDERIWEPALFFKDSLNDHSNPEFKGVLRSFKDYFDLPAAVACARAIDALDKEDGPQEVYDLWQDVHVAMCNLYRREHFRNDEGGFFPEIKYHPEKYLYECSDKLKKWLKQINEHTYTFMISGSSIDYASHIATYVLGEDWRDYFDTVVCTSKKPAFWTSNNPFKYIIGADDGDAVPPNKLQLDGTYSGGNWTDLSNLLKEETSIENPHCLYIGDHLAYDVLAPGQIGIHSVAIVEELAAEGMCGDSMEHDAGPDLMSSYWGSFFTTDGNNRIMGLERINTLYASIPLKYARIAIPSLEAVALKPIKHPFEAFGEDASGYYPGDPVILHF